jgi:hypothetical protein
MICNLDMYVIIYNLELTSEQSDVLFPPLHSNSPANCKRKYVSFKLFYKQLYNSGNMP